MEFGKSLRLDFFSQRGGCPQGSALGSQSQSHKFGIGIWIGIDFSEFWDKDRFFKILESGSIFQNFGIGINFQNFEIFTYFKVYLYKLLRLIF